MLYPDTLADIDTYNHQPNPIEVHVLYMIN